MPATAAAPGVSGFEKPTRGHAVKLSPPTGVSVEECEVIVSNVPPFLKNVMLLRELSRHGCVVSPMRLIPLGSKSPLLRHVVSFRRQVSMVLNNNKEELKLTLRFRLDQFDYTVFVTTDSLKCFGCGGEGHVVVPEWCGGSSASRPARKRSAARTRRGQ
ncbi:Transposon TX1 uncharacterized 82 kDa protein ORF 1 [Takifugu flavidus]|uniref:Transposon TX1 uncharacterized 82 kDa protein ORF 1 n=1 Tax=Takifugu flavidus TaxID=433684 RepID=A0A5C6NKZ5_9TELE|nr:Transposon TX1 uncharacterized 82 kDa protein ORF 1 [Takifugu flavidus]